MLHTLFVCIFSDFTVGYPLQYINSHRPCWQMGVGRSVSIENGVNVHFFRDHVNLSEATYVECVLIMAAYMASWSHRSQPRTDSCGKRAQDYVKHVNVSLSGTVFGDRRVWELGSDMWFSRFNSKAPDTAKLHMFPGCNILLYNFLRQLQLVATDTLATAMAQAQAIIWSLASS